MSGNFILNFFKHDPQHWGPGVWFTMHIVAYHTQTKEELEGFNSYIEILKISIPCQKCRTHFQKYVEDHRVEDAKPEQRNGRDVTAFRWSFDFHNFANRFLKKPVVGFGTAYDYYSNLQNSKVCNIGDCTDDAVDKNEEPKKNNLLNSLIKSRKR